MTSTVIRIEASTYATLRAWADEQHKPIAKIVSDLVAQAENHRFWSAMESDFTRLRGNDEAWQEYQSEIATLEGGSMDGLAEEKAYYTPEEEAEIEAFAKSQGW